MKYLTMNQEFGFEQFEVVNPEIWIKNLTVIVKYLTMTQEFDCEVFDHDSHGAMNQEFDSEAFDHVQVCCCLIVVTELRIWLWSNWP